MVELVGEGVSPSHASRKRCQLEARPCAGATCFGANDVDATGVGAPSVGVTGVGASGVGATGAGATGVGATRGPAKALLARLPDFLKEDPFKTMTWSSLCHLQNIVRPSTRGLGRAQD